MEQQLKSRQNDIYARDRILQEKDTEVLIARGDAERARNHLSDKQATLDAFRSQLDEQYLKGKHLSDSNTKLQI